MTKDLLLFFAGEIWSKRWKILGGLVLNGVEGAIDCLIFRRVGRGMKVFRCPEPQRETWLRVAGDLVRRMSAEVDSCKHWESSPSTPWCRKQGVAKAAKGL